MIYLDTNQFGHDPSKAVFLSIQTCMGVAILANGAIFGMHFPSNPDLTSKFKSTAKYISLSGMYTMIGITYKNRYGGSPRQAVSHELERFCSAIFQNGHAYPINVFGVILPEPVNSDSHDAEFTKNADALMIGYRDHTKSNTSRVLPDETPQRFMMPNGEIKPLYGDPTASVTTSIAPGDFKVIPPTGRFTSEVKGKKLGSVAL